MAESPEFKAEPQRSPKIGEGHLAGMARQGLKELAQALAAFPDSTIRPVEEPGVFGNVTPQIATDLMGYATVLASSHRGKFQSNEQERTR